MKPCMILISHGKLSEQMYRSAQMIVGNIDDLYTVCMDEADGLDGTTKKLDAVFDKISADRPALIVADILSGTPANVAVQAMYRRDNVRVLTGMCLAMVIEYQVCDDQDVDKMADYLRETGLISIKIVEKPKLDQTEEGYED